MSWDVLGSVHTVSGDQVAHAQIMQPVTTPPPTGKLLVGMCSGSASSQVANSTVMGPLKIGRAFNNAAATSTLLGAASPDVKTAGDASGYASAGLACLFSCKPDPAAVAAGTLDSKLAALARSFPTGWQFTAWHEPENDMAGPAFKAMFDHVYRVMKAANPALPIGYIAMSYQYMAGRNPSINADIAAYFPTKTDFLGVDDYGSVTGGTGGGEFPQGYLTPLDTKPDFQRWYGQAKTYGVPLRVTEFGRSGGDAASLAARPKLLTDAETWLAAHGFDQLMYWNFRGATGTTWTLTDGPSQQAYKQIAGRGA